MLHKYKSVKFNTTTGTGRGEPEHEREKSAHMFNFYYTARNYMNI